MNRDARVSLQPVASAPRDKSDSASRGEHATEILRGCIEIAHCLIALAVWPEGVGELVARDAVGMRLDEQREESPQHTGAGPPLPCLIREEPPCDGDDVGCDFDKRARHVQDAGGDLKKTVRAAVTSVEAGCVERFSPPPAWRHADRSLAAQRARFARGGLRP